MSFFTYIFVFDCQFESAAFYPLTFYLISSKVNASLVSADAGKAIVLTTQCSEIAKNKIKKNPYIFRGF